MKKLYIAALLGVFVASGASAFAGDITKNDITNYLMMIFGSAIEFPVAMAQQNALRCGDVASASKWEWKLGRAAHSSGFTSASVVGLLHDEQDRCCKIMGHWDLSQPCDPVKLKKWNDNANMWLKRASVDVQRRNEMP